MIKTYTIWALLAILVVVMPVTAYLLKGYITMSGQLEHLKNNETKLTQVAMNAQENFSCKLDNISQTFLNNRYILNNVPNTKNQLNVKTICEQHNGINCVINNSGQLSFIGEHERV